MFLIQLNTLLADVQREKKQKENFNYDVKII